MNATLFASSNGLESDCETIFLTDTGLLCSFRPALKSKCVRARLAIMGALAVFLLSATGVAYSQGSNPTWLEKFSLEAGCGSYRVPGAVLGFDPSITQHPSSLNGFNCNYRVEFALNGRWSLGLQAFEAPAAGNGPWARKDGNEQLAADGLIGSTTGRTNWKVTGASFTLGQKFLPRLRLHPFWRAELGVGKLDVNFTGTFNGCSTQDVGCFFPVTEPAVDSVARVIPVIAAEGGIQIDLSRGLQLGMGPYWNTGFGGTLSARYRF